MQGTEGAAKRSAMGELHDQLAKELCERIKDGETLQIAGEKKKVKVSAAVLAVARGFLKDNNVMCDEGHESAAVGKLTDAVAEHVALTDDDDAPRFTN